MRRHGTAFLTAAAFALAACGGTDDGMEGAPGTPGIVAADDAPQTVEDGVTVQIIALEGSGVGGDVRLEPEGAGTRIAVRLVGAGQGVHMGHIHGGTCAERGRSIVPLEAVTGDATGSGEAVSQVDMPLDSLMDGNHIIVYHEAGGAPGASVACAEIPRR
jgi:hypothetical protein